MSEATDPTVSLALRFHGNFYHSYQADTPDELGFGKDIRIIRSILDDLDRLNAEGIPVKGTWDVENYYSWEQFIPAHSPDILERIQKRCADRMDVAAPMSYNNGIVSAATEEEFRCIASSTLRNSRGSGIEDLFENTEGVVRPQECMYTPSFLSRYPEFGVTAISIYYSTHPFNGFSNFIPELPLEQRYNPTVLKGRSRPGEMILVPACNNGDVADHWLSLRRWLKYIRRQQLRMADPRDLLLCIDMDADDEFWSGMEIPLLSRVFPSFDGLYRMIRSLDGLGWLRYTTAGEYLETHEPVGEVYLDQDTADGAWDGYSSWAEKWSNSMLWRKIQKARRTADAAVELMGSTGETGHPDADPAFVGLREEALRLRTLSMSTTHFGLTSPVMNAPRMKTAEDWCDRALTASRDMLEYARERGGTAAEQLPARESAGAGAWIRLNAGDSGAVVPGGAYSGSTGRLSVTGDGIGNGLVSVRCGLSGGVSLFRGDESLSASPVYGSAAVYAGRMRRPEVTENEITEIPGGAMLTMAGLTRLPENRSIRWIHIYRVFEGLPYIHVDVETDWPETRHASCGRKLSRMLQRTWDGRWQAVMPWEFRPELGLEAGEAARVWKHNFFDEVSSYELDYFRFSGNRNIDSLNNHITHGWAAFSSRRRGLLLAQSELFDNSFAFCPLRLRHRRDRQELSLNPFGTYNGKQMAYQTSATGLGRMLSLGLSDHLRPYAPSFNGRTTRFSLMLAPFDGPEPPMGLREDAMMFARMPVHP